MNRSIHKILIGTFQKVLTKVLEEAGYERDCTLSLEDFMTVHSYSLLTVLLVDTINEWKSKLGI
jgi:hypothetical protein